MGIMAVPTVSGATFNKRLNLLLLSPLLGLLALYVLPYYGPEFFSGLYTYYYVFSVFTIPVVWLYVAQRKYIRSAFPGFRFKSQTLLLLLAVVVPALATLAGDVHGAAEFGTTLYGVTGVLIYGGPWAALSASIVLIGLAVGNALYIATGGSKKPLHYLALVCYSISYVGLAVVAYYAYAIMYILHDPHTE